MRNLVLFLVGICFFVTPYSDALSEEVNSYAQGYYDGENDWLIIKWYSDQHKEERTSIHDYQGKIAPAVSAETTYQENAGFKYSYVVSNGGSSVQTIKSFLLTFYSDILDTTAPTPEWSSRLNQPSGKWHWSNNRGGVDGIPPNSSVSGFSVTSQSFPTIVEARFYGRKRIKSRVPSPNYEPDQVSNAFFDELDRLRKKYPNKTKRYMELKTIGPTAPPEDLNATDFMQSIIDMKHEAQELGWIKEAGGKGIIGGLDKKLDNALKAIKSGDTSSAKNILEAFIKQVEAQGCATYDDCQPGKHLMPEAYALLKFNAQYLIDNM